MNSRAKGALLELAVGPAVSSDAFTTIGDIATSVPPLETGGGAIGGRLRD